MVYLICQLGFETINIIIYIYLLFTIPFNYIAIYTIIRLVDGVGWHLVERVAGQSVVARVAEGAQWRRPRICVRRLVLDGEGLGRVPAAEALSRGELSEPLGGVVLALLVEVEATLLVGVAGLLVAPQPRQDVVLLVESGDMRKLSESYNKQFYIIVQYDNSMIS